MSRIGKTPVTVPNSVKITLDDGFMTVKGPKGELSRQLDKRMIIQLDDGTLTVSRPDDEKESRSQHGLTRSLIANMVTGVSTGFTKNLEMSGVGYRAQLQGSKLVLQVGFSHPVEVEPPKGITFNVEAPTRFSVSGFDKELVGETAAQIRRVRPPEPYKGKGIRYANEVVRRKAGKAGKAGGKKK
jgi:large subunit ribosomal protein L6